MSDFVVDFIFSQPEKNHLTDLLEQIRRIGKQLSTFLFLVESLHTTQKVDDGFVRRKARNFYYFMLVNELSGFLVWH